MTAFIKLDQFLKAQQIVSSGGQAKMLIQDGQVMVNGVTETRRGRKLTEGDQVEVIGFSSYMVELEPKQDF